MITLKDLKNRVYNGKNCIRFEYEIEYDVDVHEKEKLTANFIKQEHQFAQLNEWKMQIIKPRTRDKDSDVYYFGYVMPKENLPLELIAATGLRYFQLYLKEEIQIKSNIDFALGEIIKGM